VVGGASPCSLASLWATNRGGTCCKKKRKKILKKNHHLTGCWTDPTSVLAREPPAAYPS